MDSKTTNLKLKYRIEERPGIGWVAISDDPASETIEAATKVELFEKLREKTAALLGSQLPMNFDGADGGLNAVHADRNVVVNIETKRKTAFDSSPQYAAEADSTPLANQGSGMNIWKVLFFVLLALVIGWFVIHNR